MVLVLTGQPTFVTPALLMNEGDPASGKYWGFKSSPRFL